MKLPYLVFALICGLAQAANPPARLPDSPTAKIKDLGNVRQEIDSLKKDIQSTAETKKQTEEMIQESEAAIQESTKALNELQKKQSTNVNRLKSLRERLDDLKIQVAETRTRVILMLKRQHRSSQAQTLQILLGGSDPNQIARDTYYYRYIAQSQQQLIDDLTEQENALKRISQNLEGELSKLSKQSLLELQEKTQHLQSKSTHESQAMQLNKSLAVKQAKLKALVESEQRLTALINQINKAIAARKLQQQKQALAQKNKQAQINKENERRRKLAAQAKKEGKKLPDADTKPIADTKVTQVADDSVTGKSFKALQGRLKMPVAGSIGGRFGTARPEGSQWRGLFIKTATGQSVRSIADGVIAYADVLRGFGNSVVVDHGGGYMSVYTGLSSMSLSPGARVTAGNSLGTSGQLDDGATGLYFELRYLGRPINPASWVR